MGIGFNYLAYSRRSDRCIMERTLDIIESMAHSGIDAIASKIARILRHLLAIEADVASGTIYSINSSKIDDKALECHGKLTNGGNWLQIYITYFGTINFERCAISETISAVPTTPHQSLPTTMAADMLLPDQLAEQNQKSPSGPDYQMGGHLEHQNTQTVRLQFDHLASPQRLPLTPSYGAPSFSSSDAQDA